MDMSAAGRDRFLQLRQMLVQLPQRLVLNRSRPLTDQIGIRQRGPRLAISAAQRIAQLPQNLLQSRISQRGFRGGEKLMVCFAKVIGHLVASTAADNWCFPTRPYSAGNRDPSTSRD